MKLKRTFSFLPQFLLSFPFSLPFSRPNSLCGGEYVNELSLNAIRLHDLCMWRKIQDQTKMTAFKQEFNCVDQVEKL